MCSAYFPSIVIQLNFLQLSKVFHLETKVQVKIKINKNEKDEMDRVVLLTDFDICLWAEPD